MPGDTVQIIMMIINVISYIHYFIGELTSTKFYILYGVRLIFYDYLTNNMTIVQTKIPRILLSL